jgi:hypothetical protein
MAYEQRDNSGTVFANDRKESDRHPDYTGKAMVGGVMYWASMWVKEKQDGEEFFSFSLKPMDDQPQQPQQRRQEPARDQQREPQRPQSRRVQPQAQDNRGGRAPSRSSGFDDLDQDIPF